MMTRLRYAFLCYRLITGYFMFLLVNPFVGDFSYDLKDYENGCDLHLKSLSAKQLSHQRDNGLKSSGQLSSGVRIRTLYWRLKLEKLFEGCEYVPLQCLTLLYL